MKRFLIAGGGTGGHLYPGVAVAMEARKEGIDVLFIGTEKGIEARVLPREGFGLRTIKAGRLKGMGMAEKIRTLAGIPGGILQAAGIIREFGPQAVVGVGGYASFPAVAAAKLAGIPVVIQEQNAYPGLTNRVLGRVADAVAIGFEEAAGFFPKGRSVFTGNPIRGGMLAVDRGAALDAWGLKPDRFTVLVFGGSGGAHRINKGVTDALLALAGLEGSIQFIHQTGEKDLAMVEGVYAGSGFTAKVSPFIYDMAGAYACADLVVCRSGALTLAELTALGKPALLVPYPHAANNHQEANARALERAGAARVIMDSDATGDRLAAEINGLINDRAALSGMSGKCLALGKPDAAIAVLRLVKSLMKG
jgi:UDP-N-acetylglucosamine--N-acetylmuramyl-(pentapeptide) pyrophosphoryl-undecaprenol N-acetylglucosamine transferase